MDSIFQKDV